MAERAKTKRQAAAPAADSGAAATKPTAVVDTPTKRASKSTTSKSGTTKTAKAAASKGAAGGGGASPEAKQSRTGSAPSKGTTTRKKPEARQTRSAAETERIREALTARRDELREEYGLHVAEIAELQRDRLTDAAGDDQADTGSKTFEHEQEISLAHSILERTTQVERALERLEEGNYGWCERCGDAIPVERLAAFPSATLCVACKQLEERR